MPFTGSHPAAVIPLMGTPLVPSALVIGSMVPDLPYYVPLPISFAFTHTLSGLISIDLAMALVCFAIWHVLLAPVSVALAPDPLRRRLAPGLPGPWREHLTSPRAVLIIVSILIATLTHVIWDEFTHLDHWGPRHITWLAQRHGPLDGYRWAQYASGIFGMAVIVATLWRWWQRTPATDTQRVPRLSPTVATGVWSAVLGATLLGAAAGFLTAHSRGDVLSRALYHAATLGGGTGLLTAILSALWCAHLLNRSPTRQP